MMRSVRHEKIIAKMQISPQYRDRMETSISNARAYVETALRGIQAEVDESFDRQLQEYEFC